MPNETIRPLWRDAETGHDSEHYKSLAQLRKARTLAHVMRTLGADAMTAELMTAEGRRNAERAAGVPESSDTTWGMVFILLAG